MVLFEFRFARRVGVVAGVLVFAVVLAVQLWRLDLRAVGVDDEFASYLGNAQSLADGGPYGLPLFIPQEGDGAEGGVNPPLYPVLLAPVVGLAAEPVRAMAWLDAVLVAGFAAGLALYGLADLGVVCAVGLGLVAGLGPELSNPGALHWPGAGLQLLLLVAALLWARRLGSAGVGGVVAMGALIGMGALASLPGGLLATALLLAGVRPGRLVEWRAVVAVLVAGVLVTAAMLVFGTQYIVWPTMGGPGGGADLVRAVLGGAARLPGHLMALWPGRAAGDGWGGVLDAVLVLGLAAVGFVVRVRRGVGVAETLFVLQTGVFLGLGVDAARDWLAVSVLTLVYAVGGGVALGGLARRRRLGGALVVAAAAGHLLAAGVASPLLPYSLMDPAVQEGLRKIRLTIPPNSVLVGEHPWALAYFTGRAAAELRVAPTDAGFWNWVAAVRATHLVMAVGERASLAGTEAAMFGPGRPGIDLVLDTGFYRLYRLLGPVGGPVGGPAGGQVGGVPR